MGDNSQGHELKGKIHSLPSSVLPAVYAVVKNETIQTVTNKKWLFKPEDGHVFDIAFGNN